MSAVCVVGCGVIGLTGALELLRAGVTVTILAERLPPDTTSDRAGALCYPFKAGPPGRCLAWAGQSLAVYAAQARSDAEAAANRDAKGPVTGAKDGSPGATAEAGHPDTRDQSSRLAARQTPAETAPHHSDARLGRFVREVDCLVLAHQDGKGDIPWEMTFLGPDRLRPATRAELPPGCDSGFVARTALVQAGPYLAALMDLFREAGGTIERRRLERLEDAPGEVALNCTGLGSARLAGDAQLVPVSGRIVTVRPKRQVRCLLDEGNPAGLTYCFPRPDLTVLGGTAVSGDLNTEPDPAQARSILARTLALEPALRDAEVLGQAVGLRPYRPRVRLEAARLADGRTVVHHYGHGGSGWTLAWGAAREAARLALSAL